MIQSIVYVPALLKGAGYTLLAWLVAGSISFIIALLMAIMSCRAVDMPTMRAAIRCYTFITKGVPAYVQILIAYFVLPALIGINVPASIAAVGALAFCSSGYMTEIIRAGINSIPQGQWDACFVLGYSMPTTFIRIIVPQTCAQVLPSVLGEFEQLLKSTCLLATIGITELTRTGVNIISRELNPIPIYSLVALVYLMLSAALQVSIWYIKTRNYRGNC